MHSNIGLKKIEPILNQLTELREKYDKTPAQIAKNWLIAQGDVIPIPGAKNAKQAQENAGAMGWLLSNEDVKQLSLLSGQ